MSVNNPGSPPSIAHELGVAMCDEFIGSGQKKGAAGLFGDFVDNWLNKHNLTMVDKDELREMVHPDEFEEPDLPGRLDELVERE